MCYLHQSYDVARHMPAKVLLDYLANWGDWWNMLLAPLNEQFGKMNGSGSEDTRLLLDKIPHPKEWKRK